MLSYINPSNNDVIIFHQFKDIVVALLPFFSCIKFFPFLNGSYHAVSSPISKKHLGSISLTNYCPITQLHYNKIPQKLCIFLVSKSFLYLLLNPLWWALAITFQPKLLVKVTNDHHVAKSNDQFSVLILIYQQLLTQFYHSLLVLTLIPGYHILQIILRVFLSTSVVTSPLQFLLFSQIS